MVNSIIFGVAALLILIIGGIAEHRIEDESWGRKKRFRQQVEEAYTRSRVRLRAQYAQIGWRPGR